MGKSGVGREPSEPVARRRNLGRIFFRPASYMPFRATVLVFLIVGNCILNVMMYSLCVVVRYTGTDGRGSSVVR